MQNLVPHFILEKHALGQNNGSFDATSLFVDISGFSVVTHALSQHGSEAAEIMAGIMFNIFEPLVEAVYAQGGFISSFAGDAFTAIFPSNEQHPLKALAAARTIQSHLANHPIQETAYGSFPFAIKLGLGNGLVNWGILQPSQTDSQPAPLSAFYFSGPAVESAAATEHHAQPGHLVLAPQVAAALTGFIQAMPVSEQGHVRMLGLESKVSLPAPLELPAPETLPGQASFVPAEILAFGNTLGEFRQVITVFINLMDVHSHADLEPFIQAVFTLQRTYGGYLARVDFGDKGCNLLLFWGAPTSHENDIERALSFTLALGEHTPGSHKAGLTSCMMYAGLAGSPRRGEWTCYGDGINLAARLMISAPWGSLWLDERLARQAEKHFVLQKAGEQTFKGFDAPQAVYTLLEKQSPGLSDFFHGPMVGHAAEMEQLAAFVRPLLDDSPPKRKFAGILAVEGEAGLGKSRLVTEFLMRLTSPAENNPAGVQWALCQTDPTVRAPFNPWRYWLRNYFEQSSSRSAAHNKRTFGRALDRLIAATGDENLRNELNQGRSFLGALVDLHWDNSPYAAVGPAGRYELTLSALTALVRAESLRCPLVISLEDAHWLDEDSLACLVRLAQTAAGAPFAVIATARPQVGDRPLFGELPYQRLELGPLSPIELEQMAQDVLDAPIDSDLAALLVERAEGNPFFAEQILLFLREQGTLQKQNEHWQLAETGATGATLPTDVRLIFTSRLDSLSADVRDAVQTAAILGREFEVRILADMLRAKEYLPFWLHEAEGNAVWVALNEIQYIFKHALLRDAAYEMQLRARRRELHKLAAQAMEKLYAVDIAPHYPEIAYHYLAAYRQGLTEARQPALNYLEWAGQRAASVYENAAALQNFSAALELLEAEETERRWNLLLQREAIYNLTGERPAQSADLEALTTLAEASQNPDEQALVSLRWGRYAEATGQYNLALTHIQAAATLSHSAGRTDLEAEAQRLWGYVLFRMSNYPSAAEHAQQALTLARAAGETANEAVILRLLASTAGELGDMNASREYNEQSLALGRSIGDKVNEGKALGNLGTIADDLGDFTTARAYYEQSLEISRSIGDRRTESTALCNLGLLVKNQGNLTAAREYFEQYLAICRAIGDPQGKANALEKLGRIAGQQDDLAAARSYYQQSLGVSRATNDRYAQASALANLGEMFLYQGDFPAASDHLEQSLALFRAIDDQLLEGWLLATLADLRYKQEEMTAAEELANQALEISHQTESRELEAKTRCILGQAYLQKNSPAQAGEQFAITQTIALELENQGLLAEALAGLAQAAIRQNDSQAARAALLQAIPILEEKPTLAGASHPILALLQIGKGWLALGESTGKQVIEKAYQYLQARAAKMPDEAARHTFLEKIPANRELCALYAQLDREMITPKRELPTAAPPVERAETSPPATPPTNFTFTTSTPDLDKQALAAQIIAQLGETAQAQGITLIILGDIHINQIVLGGRADSNPEPTRKTRARPKTPPQ